MRDAMDNNTNKLDWEQIANEPQFLSAKSKADGTARMNGDVVKVHFSEFLGIEENKFGKARAKFVITIGQERYKLGFGASVIRDLKMQHKISTPIALINKDAELVATSTTLGMTWVIRKVFA